MHQLYRKVGESDGNFENWKSRNEKFVQKACDSHVPSSTETVGGTDKRSNQHFRSGLYCLRDLREKMSGKRDYGGQKQEYLVNSENAVYSV